MLKKISFTAFSYAYIQFVAFIIFIITAKFFGVEGRGLYAASLSAATACATVIGLSIGMVLPYFVVNNKTTRDVFFKDNLYTIVSLIFLLTIVCVIVFFSAWFIRPSLFGKLSLPYLLAISISFPYFMWFGSNDYVFSTSGNIIQQNKITLINRTVFLICSLFFLYLMKVSLLTYIIIYGVFNLLQLCQEIYFMASTYNAVLKFNKKLCIDIIKKGLQVHMVTIAGILWGSLGILAINYTKDLKETGNFSFASQMTALLMVLPAIINRYMISEITATDANAVWKKQKKVIRLCLLVMLFATVLAYFLIVPFCTIFKNEFTDAIPVFRLMLLAIIPSTFCTLMQSQWYSRGYFKIMSVTNIIVGSIGAVITLLLVPKYKATGAAITTIFTYVSLFLVNFIFYLKIDKKING